MKKFLIITIKSVVAIALTALLAITVTGVSPIYDFTDPEPFSGPDIYNPYGSRDSSFCWKRANLHTHTKVEGIFNECNHTPREVYDSLAGFGYEIVAFSNHNRLTTHPEGLEYQTDSYEHGYNLCKFHKNVFGCTELCRFDNLLPVLASQRQFQLDLLQKSCEFIQLNHPTRTDFTTASQMRKLSGYRLIELDSGKTTEQEYWDEALSAGHYSCGTANDDLHFPDRSWKIAVRCNFISTPSSRYEDLKKALISGNFYSMRVPDYGSGDWATKHAKNTQLPEIQGIGLRNNTVWMKLSQPADSIKLTGQGASVLASCRNSDELSYRFRECDTYARFTAYFADGAVIYSNPFARYNACGDSCSDGGHDCGDKGCRPFRVAEHSVNIPLTILFNLMLLLFAVGEIYLIIKLFRKKKNNEK